MSRSEDIDNGIWDDPDFAALSPHATLLYLWSWTNPRCGWSGLYKVPVVRMTESKVPSDAIQAALDELAAANFLFYEDGVLWVRARVKRLRARSPQMAKSVAKDLRNLADHPLVDRFVETYGGDSWLREALSDRYRYPSDRVSKNPVAKPDSHTVSIPSRDGTGTGEGTGTGTGVRTREDGERLPEDFPEEVRPHLRAVWRPLQDLAVRHHAKAFTANGLALTVIPRAHKPLVKAAYDFIAWSDGQPTPRKDIVAGYRNWLDKLPDLAGYEQLDDRGFPMSGPPVRSVSSGMSDLDRKRLEAINRLVNQEGAA